VGLHDRELGYNAEFLYPRGGIGELPEAIHRALPVRAEPGVAATAIDARRRIVYAGREAVPYRRLISTLPLPRTIALLADAPARVRRLARRLRCAPLDYLDVALDRPAGNDHHWSYVPEARLPFYRVGAYTNFSAGVAPRGKGSLYVELASRGPFRAGEHWPRVLRGLVEMGLVRGAPDVRFVRHRRLPFAYVLYDRAWEETRAALHAFLRERGITACGRYGSWEYSAMEDALLEGRAAAEQAKEG
jgi:protoporphyrinogen oxidase